MLGTAYLSGSIGLSLQRRDHGKVGIRFVEPPQAMTMYLTPRKKTTEPKLPSISPLAALLERSPGTEAGLEPGPPPVADTPPPAPPLEIAQEPAQPKPKPTPVVSAKKSTFALKGRRQSQRTSAMRPPETTAAEAHDHPPERIPAPPKTAATSGAVPASQLDALPRLLNSPSVIFPASVRRSGLKEGRAVLEVEIDIRGRVTVRRIVEISNPALERTARNFAAAARFSTPRRGGQPVRALFRWPLTLRP